MTVGGRAAVAAAYMYRYVRHLVYHTNITKSNTGTHSTRLVSSAVGPYRVRVRVRVRVLQRVCTQQEHRICCSQ